MNTFKGKMACWFLRVRLHVLQGQVRRARKMLFARRHRRGHQLELPFRG